MFLPNPPNKHLTTIIANALPTAHCHKGTFVLKFNAKINPVTIALKSKIVCFFLQTKLNKNSAATALATQTKINKKDILAFEEGKYLPTLENSLKLAKALDFPQEYFYKKDNVKVILENTHVAVPGRVPRVEEVACREQLLMTHKIVTLIEDYIDIPKLNLPTKLGKNINEEQLAQITREHFNLNNEAILNVADVMEENGIIVSDINNNKKGSVALTQKQSVDKNVRYGVLENGLTYILRHNDESKNRANFKFYAAKTLILPLPSALPRR